MNQPWIYIFKDPEILKNAHNCAWLLSRFGHGWFFLTLWTVARQAHWDCMRRFCKDLNQFILKTLASIAQWIIACVCMKLSCFSRVWLCNPVDCSPPGSSVYGILQARKLEWVAMPCSRGSSWPRNWTCVSYVSCIGRQFLYHQSHLGSPLTLCSHWIELIWNNLALWKFNMVRLF